MRLACIDGVSWIQVSGLEELSISRPLQSIPIMFAKYWQQAKQTVLGSGQATAYLHKDSYHN